MSRREFQSPTLLKRLGKRGEEYYIRYRIKVVRMVDGKAKKTKREKWHVIGLCDEMTERQAMRERERILREVNGQVYSIQSQIPFGEFVKLYRERWMSDLRHTTQTNYDRLLRNYIEPYFANDKLCDIKPQDVHQFIMGLEIAPLSRKSVRGVMCSGTGRVRVDHWSGYDAEPCEDCDNGITEVCGRCELLADLDHES